MKKSTIVLLACLPLFSFAQSTEGGGGSQPQASPDGITNKISPREFNIPISPLFDLMGVAPAIVSRTSEIKDFKVDWSFKSYKINPNLAIETQPVWEIFYNRKNLKRYRQSGWLAQRLASLDLSLGTVQNEANDRRIGGALKMNLYRARDPLLESGMYDDIQQAYDTELVQLRLTEKSLLRALDTTVGPAGVAALRQQLHDNDAAMATFYSRRRQAIGERAATYIADNWNSAYVDFAYGKIYTYSTDSTGSLKHLIINRNTGYGLWLNAGYPLGRRGMISGLLRTSFYEEQLEFATTDATGNTLADTAIAGNKLYTMGINLRYGGPVYNFFVEFVYERKAFKTAVSALNDVFTPPDGATLVESSVKWDVVKPYTFSFGGDWRISRNVILDFGIRCVLDKQFKSSTFLPVVNVSCLMR